MQKMKIPTVFAFLLIAVLLGGISIAIEQALRIPTQANPSRDAQNLMITNVTDSSCSIIWETDTKTTGMVTATLPNGNKITGFDERDTIGKLGKYVTHSITLRNIPSQTTFKIKPSIDGKAITLPETNANVTTGAPLSSSQSSLLDPAYGTVKSPEGTPAEGAIVTLSIEGSQTLSSLVKPSGTWIIPLSTIRTKDLSVSLPTVERMTEFLTISLGEKKSTVTSDTLNDSPMPDILLGNTYDFRNYQAKQKESSTLAVVRKTSESVLGAQSGKVTLTNPVAGASLVSTKPLIQGTGIPGKQIVVTIGITSVQSGKTTVGTTGIWQFTPGKPLAAGKQSVTITTVDENNKSVAITHEFTILKSGSQVLGDATPSATTVTPTLTPEPTSTESATLAAEPMPSSGSPLPVIILTLVGIIFIGGGAFLYFKSE